MRPLEERNYIMEAMDALITDAESLQMQDSLAQDLEATFNSTTGHLYLSPKFVRYFLNIECKDKQPSETYKNYCERLQGHAISKGKEAALTWKVFEKHRNPDKMDITMLGNVFDLLFKIKKDSRNKGKFIQKLQCLKDLRNEVMHDYDKMKDAGTLNKLEPKLHDFIQEAGVFYSLSQSDLEAIHTELESGINFAQEKKIVFYARTQLVSEGETSMRLFLRNFSNENLMFDMGQVERSTVFHAPDVIPARDEEGKTFPYVKIFEQREKTIIVSGVAGAGKSTLLENIALQFIHPTTDTSTQLKDFELLVYIQCRDHTTKTLKQVIKQQFPKTCVSLGEDIVLDALASLRVLFLVDGHDEYDRSMTILQDVFKRMWQVNWRVIIATRSHAVERLEQMLSDFKVNCKEFEISPISDLEQQLKFLARYEPLLSCSESRVSVRESFQSLKEPLRILFKEPLKLLQFCNVFATFPERIAEWKTRDDSAKDTYQIYKELTKKQLNKMAYPNTEIVLEDVFQVICEAALTFLRLNVPTFTADQFKDLQKQCLSKLREEHGIKDMDVQLVLSSVLKVKRLFSNQGVTTYSFSHRNDEEYFASQFVVRQMMNGTESLREILLGRTSPTTVDNDEAESIRNTPPNSELALGNRTLSLEPYLEVLKYVVQDLNASANRSPLLDHRWAEVKKALQDAGVATHKDWQRYAVNYPDVPHVARQAAEETLAVEPDWNIRDRRDLAAVAKMLPHGQPRALKVGSIEPCVLRETLWPEVIQHMVGDLSLYFYTTNECDELLSPLENSRCRLTAFCGAIASSAGIAVISSIATAATELDIWLKAPLQLNSLEGKYKQLTVYTPPFTNVEEDEKTMPLPSHPSPWLVVKDACGGSWKAVAATIRVLAPAENMYCALKLLFSSLSDDDLNRLAVALHQMNIRTEGDGPTSWVKESTYGDHRLYITDDLPAHLRRIVKMKNEK